MKKIIINIILVLFFIFPIFINAEEKDITMYLFYGRGCPHCRDMEKFLNDYLKDKDNITLKEYEVWYNEENANLLSEAKEIFKSSSVGIPYLIIGNEVIIGFSNSTGNTIKRIVSYYENNEYIDVYGIKKGLVDEKSPKESTINEPNVKEYKIKFLGKIDPKNVSLTLVSIILGFVDGFNPCAMWILLFLIAMLFNMKNKKKMWILGIIFLLTSSITYLIFMVSWLNLANYLNEFKILKIFIGIFSIAFGIYNIVRFVKTKENACDVVNTTKRKTIMNKIKVITQNKMFILSILGIMVLAIAVNLIELFCSLGLPMMFTEILSLNNLSNFKYWIYILIYIFFFMLDDLIIFVIAMKTLEIKGISNKYGKFSHLIGGIIMFLIGVLIIFKPEWLMFNFK